MVHSVYAFLSTLWDKSTGNILGVCDGYKPRREVWIEKLINFLYGKFGKLTRDYYGTSEWVVPTTEVHLARDEHTRRVGTNRERDLKPWSLESEQPPTYVW